MSGGHRARQAHPGRRCSQSATGRTQQHRSATDPRTTGLHPSLRLLAIVLECALKSSCSCATAIKPSALRGRPPGWLMVSSRLLYCSIRSLLFGLSLNVVVPPCHRVATRLIAGGVRRGARMGRKRRRGGVPVQVGRRGGRERWGRRGRGYLGDTHRRFVSGAPIPDSSGVCVCENAVSIESRSGSQEST